MRSARTLLALWCSRLLHPSSLNREREQVEPIASQTTSFPPTWSSATAGSPRARSGGGHRCSSTATCKSNHVFVAGDEVTGIVDWSEGAQGDALFDLATLTLGHPEHLDDVIAGYGTDVDRDLIPAWWSLRCLSNIRWLAKAGYGSPEEFPEVAVLRSQT